MPDEDGEYGAVKANPIAAGSVRAAAWLPLMPATKSTCRGRTQPVAVGSDQTNEDSWASNRMITAET